VLTTMDPPPAEGKFLWQQQPPRETLHHGTVQLSRGLRWQFWSYG